MGFVYKSRGHQPQAARRAEVPRRPASRRSGHQDRFRSKAKTCAAFDHTNVETRAGEIHVLLGLQAEQSADEPGSMKGFE